MDPGYRSVLGRPAARRLLAAMALAWLGFGMAVLAVFLSAERATGSAVTAGLAVAAFSVGAGALAPLRGRMLDRRGTHPWLAVFAAAHGAALMALAVVARGGAGDAPVVAAAGAAGLVAPPLIAALRLRWAKVLPEGDLRRAYALTSLVGDAGMVAGPALSGLLFALRPWLPLVVCAVGVTGAALLAGGDGRAHAAPATRARLAGPGMTALLGVSVGLGLAVGMVEVTVPVAALRWRVGGWSGVLLAAFAAGSVAGGLWFGRRRWPGGPLRRYLLSAAALAALLLPLAVAVGPVSLGLLLVVAGLGYGPATIALFEALDALAPDRGTEAFTWVTTAEAAGSAAGAAAAGWTATHHGLHVTFAAGAAVLALAAGWGLMRARVVGAGPPARS